MQTTGYDGSIAEVVNFEGCEIVQLEGGYFEPRFMQVANADDTHATDEVIIHLFVTAIHPDVVITSADEKDIYSL
ncbi:MAG: hypothetical protein SPI30_03465 [Prevotella sp.]|nr:hypothetical protein [Prevotella sp.]